MTTLTEKWAKVLDLEGAPAILDEHRRSVTAQLIENQVNFLKSSAEHDAGFFTALNEDISTWAPVNHGGDGLSQGGISPTATNTRMMGYDPVLINLVRRAMPQLIAFDICGVQPMTMPTGLIFALKARYNNQGGDEALFNEAITSQSGKGTHQGSNWADGTAYTTGTGMTTAEKEKLGTDGNTPWAQMAFSIERTQVIAQARALKAEYTMELAQDLKAVHGLDAEQELSNILATEILAEINREIVRNVYTTAVPGAQVRTATAGTFDLDIDSDGRWSAEKYKSLMMCIEREANAIAQRTRRGRGNFIICSSDVASALQMAGMLDYAPALAQNKLNIDEANNTFAGVLNGKYKVFIDPYTANQAAEQYFVMGYKGASPYDAGMFYCPYVPLQLVKAQDPNSFQPKIGFQTRYGIAYNPMVQLDAGKGNGTVTAEQMANLNYYYRKVIIKNL